MRADSEAALGVGALLSSAPEFWSTYRSIRLRPATLPFNDLERGLVDQVAAAMVDSLRLPPAEAAYQGRRTALFRRERLLHEALALDVPPRRLATFADALDVEGVQQVRSLRAGEPVVLLSLHYSLFSSLLCLWLTRLAAHQTTFRYLTILFDSGSLAPQPVPSSRIDALVEGGWGQRETTTLLNVALPKEAAPELVTRLRSGEAVRAFHDGFLLPVSECEVLTARLGHRTLSLGRGLPFLVRRTHASLVPHHGLTTRRHTRHRLRRADPPAIRPGRAKQHPGCPPGVDRADRPGRPRSAGGLAVATTTYADASRAVPVISEGKEIGLDPRPTRGTGRQDLSRIAGRDTGPAIG